MPTDTRPRRLVLNPAELELLRRRSGNRPLPEDFRLEARGPGGDEALAAAVGTLASRGAVRPGPGGDPLACEVHASVRANLGVLTGPEVLLTTRARYRDRTVHAAHAVAGPLGASLVRAGGADAELSLFAAVDLGRELVRTVPEPETGRTWDRAVTVALEALMEAGLDPTPGNGSTPTAAARPSPADVGRARSLERDTVGILHCLVLGPASPERGATAGQVVWFALPGGWLGAMPAPRPPRRTPGPPHPRRARRPPHLARPPGRRSPPMSDPPEIEVSGGRGGITARYQDMETTADLIDGTSADLLALAADCHRILADPDLLASAALDPEGFARVEAALLAALDGPHGLTPAAARIAARAVAIRTAVITYQAADQLAADLLTVRQFLQGQAGLPVLTIAGLAGVGIIDDPAAMERLLTEHPGIMDETVGSLPGFLAGIGRLAPPGVQAAFTFSTGETLFPTTVPQGAGMLGVLYPDGRPVVRDLGVDTSQAGRTVPRTFADLMLSLDRRNNAARDERQGQIDVRVVEQEMSDGSVRQSFIVDIPGTKAWNVNPAGDRTFLNDLGTNLGALGNEETSYERGVAEALQRAGAGPEDAVMLVGHSQGGMVAMQAANHFTRDGRFNVTHVVTAGSPVAQMPVPDRVQALSLENEHDVVPHLDARDNPDEPNRVTVTFDAQYGTIGRNHSIRESYVSGAQGMDGSADPSLVAYREGAEPFFSGDRVRTEVYQVTREG